MYRQYVEPNRSQFDTEEEYEEAMEAYDAECLRREDEYRERYLERIYG